MNALKAAPECSGGEVVWLPLRWSGYSLQPARPPAQMCSQHRRPASPWPRLRDYWPTGGWRCGAGDHGMDSAALAQVDDQVAKAYPQVRSVLIVRHGYLVYEHYWHGLGKSSGHDIRSVTERHRRTGGYRTRRGQDQEPGPNRW